MTLKEYIGALQQLAEESPEALEFPVIYSSDDEGNSYHNVYSNGTLVEVEDLESRNIDLVCRDDDEEEKPNAVIIN